MVRENKKPNRGQEVDIDEIKHQLEMLDERIDNIDSVVTAVAERVMNQPITLIVNCPHCGKNVEVSIIGKLKPTL